MVVHIAPIGESTGHVLEWIREVTPVTKIYLIHSKKSKETNFPKKARELENKYDLLLQDSKNTVSTAVANAWSSYQSSKSLLDSIRTQVKAAEIANEGITLEYESGSKRTTLEVIQSKAFLLDSRIDLVTSERNFLISQFGLTDKIVN